MGASWDNATFRLVAVACNAPLRTAVYLYNRLAESWAALCTSNHAVRSISGEIVSEDEYVLSEYWKSKRLDLDQLSDPVTSG